MNGRERERERDNSWPRYGMKKTNYKRIENDDDDDDKEEWNEGYETGCTLELGRKKGKRR